MNPLEAYAYLKHLGNEVLGMHFSLEVPGRVLSEMGNPQLSTPAILIGGTNGKGSVSHFAAQILRRAGYRTALYTSPHLESVLERIRLNGHDISPDDFARCLTRVVETQNSLLAAGELSRRLSYFETVTLTAFGYFHEQHADVAVLEVGLGGRLDATNLSDPLVSAITSIGSDHRSVLGQTAAQIAREKAGIARPDRVLWVGPVLEEPKQAIRCTAAASRVQFLQSDDWEAYNDGHGRYRGTTVWNGSPLQFQLKVFGVHQVANAVLAGRLVESLQPLGFKVSLDAVRTALEETEIPGRLDKVLSHPIFFVDGAHNPQATEAVARFISEQFPEKVYLIFCMMSDKEIEPCAHLLAPLCKTVFLTRVQNRRSATASALKYFFPDNATVLTANSEEATTLGLAAAGEFGTLFACGSLFLVGEIKTLLRR
jgi:dihydrofolate synthase/folylpolyglutamate synthase